MDEHEKSDSDRHLLLCDKCIGSQSLIAHQWLCMKHEPEKSGYGLGCPEHAHDEDNSQLV